MITSQSAFVYKQLQVWEDFKDLAAHPTVHCTHM